jgi:hypothetical protein
VAVGIPIWITAASTEVFIEGRFEMTQYTRELEKLINKFADVTETQMKDYLNPKASVVGSFLRIAFRAKAVAKPAYEKVCAALGLNPVFGVGTAYNENVQKIIDFAKQNGNRRFPAA